MNAIARTIRTRIPLISFTTRGFLGFLIVIAVILLIIYLPDITGFHVRRAAAPVESIVPDRTEQSPLGEILNRLNEMGERKPFAPTTREAASQALHTQGVTWDVVRSDVVKVALVKAKTDCAELLNSLPADKATARFALANYQLALEQLAAGRDDRFSAEGALAYIRHLDEEVTSRFTEEQIEAPLFRRWSEISLGDALQTAENRRFREGSVTHFNPELSLNKVAIHRILPGTTRKASNFTETPRLSLEGSLLFRGVSRLTLYHNRTLMQEIEVPKPRKRAQGAHVFFVVNVEAIDGVFSFRAESEDREVYIKNYSFYPKMLYLADSPKQVDFQVGTFRQRLPRLDRYFLVGETAPERSTDGMVPF